MRKSLLLILCVLLGSISVWAQTKNISGKITGADDGQPIPGAAVMVKGTSIGTVSNADGVYSLQVPQDASALLVSYMGMLTQEVAIQGRSTINVTLQSDTKQVDEVVVTALGMRRERKALGYAVQDVKAEDLTRAGNSSVTGALQGKLAGVEIKPSSGMPGASSQIIIRGARSFTQNNAPLYVVDGMPVASTPDYSTGNSVTGADVSNRAVDLDPNDIESINILKGQAAAALYGIRASNGVVVITTKSGKSAKDKNKTIVSVSSSASADIISRTPDLQSTWAQGTPNATGGYTFDPNSSSNWGPRIMDLPNDPKYGGNVANALNGNDANKYKGMYYVPQRAKAGMASAWQTPQVYDNVDDFFEVGYTVNTSINVSQGRDNGSFALGLGNTTQSGIVPSTSMDRYTAKAVAETKLGKIWKTGFSVNFAQNYIKKAPTANDGLLATVYGSPRNYDLKGIPYASPTDPYDQVLYRATNFNNPYWGIEHNLFDEKTQRFFGNGYVEANPMEGLVVKYQLGADSYTTHFQDIHEFKSKNTLGSINNYGVTAFVYNSLITATYDRNLTEDIKLSVMVGNELNHENYKRYSELGNNFNFGGWAHINNATIKNASESQSENRTVGFFGNLNLSYRDFLFLSASGRNDYVSSMPRNNRSFFYPSVSLGVVLTELEMLKGQDLLSFAKLRASYAEVGQAGSYTPNYYYTPTYSGGFWTGQPVVYPIDGVTSFVPYPTLYDPNLKPQNTLSYEVGVDLKFLKNRIGVEYTFSRQDVKDQIFEVPLAGSTGASGLITNGGKIHTNAHEIILTATPIDTKDFSWDLSVNFSKIDNYVDELAEGVESIFLGGFVTPQVRAGIGDKFPVIYGSSYKRDNSGRILVDERATVGGKPNPYYGMPMQGAPAVIGSVSPDFLMGGSTSFNYKRVSLSATFDWKSGGQMYSGTNGLLKYSYGLDKTTEDRTTPFIYPGYKADGQPNDIKRGGEGDHTAYYRLYGQTLGSIDEAFVFENSFVKLREVSLSYKMPKYKTLNITVSAFARNILLWTNLDNLDPEATQGNNNMGGSFERFSVPQTMSFGGGLNIVF